MKKVFLILLMCQRLLGSTIDVVFDIDWTLVYPLSEQPPTHLKNVIWAEGKAYRVADWASQVIFLLSQDPNVRISFYSGGSKKRNLELLSQIKIFDRSLLDISYKTLHFEDLVQVDDRQELKFWERYKKDLTKINDDYSKVILVDDIKDFTPPAQRQNLLWLGETYEFSEYYESGKHSSKFYPPNFEAWKKERHKLLDAYLRIKKAKSLQRQEDFLKALSTPQQRPKHLCEIFLL